MKKVNFAVFCLIPLSCGMPGETNPTDFLIELLKISYHFLNFLNELQNP